MDIPYVLYVVDNSMMIQVISMGVAGGFMVSSMAGVVATACHMLISFYKTI